MIYRLLIEDNPKDMEAEVNEALADGWELQGGICVALVDDPDYDHGATGTFWAQAIVKRTVKS